MEWCGAIWRDRRGGAAIIVALCAPALIGAAGFAVDLNLLFLQQHRLQIAADAAAYTAALSLNEKLARAASPTSYETIATEAITGATANVLIGAPVTTTVTVAPSFATVTVTLTSQQPALLAAVLGQSGFSMQATATAGCTGPTIVTYSLSGSQWFDDYRSTVSGHYTVTYNCAGIITAVSNIGLVESSAHGSTSWTGYSLAPYSGVPYPGGTQGTNEAIYQIQFQNPSDGKYTTLNIDYDGEFPTTIFTGEVPNGYWEFSATGGGSDWGVHGIQTGGAIVESNVTYSPTRMTQ